MFKNAAQFIYTVSIVEKSVFFETIIIYLNENVFRSSDYRV